MIRKGYPLVLGERIAVTCASCEKGKRKRENGVRVWQRRALKRWEIEQKLSVVGDLQIYEWISEFTEHY